MLLRTVPLGSLLTNMNHVWSVLCQSSLIDIDTNNLSLNNVLEQLVLSVESKKSSSPVELTVPISYEVVSMWVKTDTHKVVRAEIVLEIVDPKGSILKTFKQQGEMPTTMKRLRTRFRIQGLGLTISGLYKFIVKIKREGQIDFDKVTEIPLEIQINAVNRAKDKN